MRENCILCQIIDGKIPSHIVYEDNDALGILDINGASLGHCFVLPKEHYPILEQLPDSLVAKLFNIANKLSTAIFDSFQVQGTNVFVANGVSAGQQIAHFMIHVIPRKDNDGVGLTWQPKQLTEEEMSTVELNLKEACKNIGAFDEAKKEKEDKKEARKREVLTEEDYMLKQMERIP